MRNVHGLFPCKAPFYDPSFYNTATSSDISILDTDLRDTTL